MTMFNVIVDDINKKNMVPYDIMPHLKRCYDETKKNKYKTTPQTFEEFKDFILKEARYQWWARCEYEIILTDWPCEKYKEKWDVFRQIEMNIDVITKLFMEDIEKTKRKTKIKE